LSIGYLEKNPLVSIGLPTFNRRSFFQRALESTLQQTYLNLQVVVSDNNSTDETVALLDTIDDPRVTILRQPANIGMMPNWNACLNAARGEFFLLLSDDDYLQPTAIEEMVRASQESGVNPEEVGFVYCRAAVIDERDRILRRSPRAAWKVARGEDALLEYLAFRQPMYPCTIMFRTSDLNQGGGYPGERFSLAADAYAWTRVAASGRKVIYVENPISHYRIHSSNMTRIVSPDEWISNLTPLVGGIKTQLEARGEHELAGRVDRASYHYMSNILSGLIVHQVRTGKSNSLGLAEFFRYRKYFEHSGGFRDFLKGIVRILTPIKIEQWMREQFHRRIQDDDPAI